MNGNKQGQEDVFFGGPFDGVQRPRYDDALTERGGIVDPVSGASYVRAPSADTPGRRAWMHAPDRNFKEHPEAWSELTAEQAAEVPSALGVPAALSTLSVRAADKEHPVNLGQLRQLVASADRMGFTDGSPVRAVVFMRGTAKALEVRAE